MVFYTFVKTRFDFFLFKLSILLPLSSYLLIAKGNRPFYRSVLTDSTYGQNKARTLTL